MKNRLSKSLNRLKKEKIVSSNNEFDSKGLSSLEVKVFRNLSEKYNLSLTINEKDSIDEEKKSSLSLGAQITLERIKKGDPYKP
jgi:hypothetical protein